MPLLQTLNIGISIHAAQEGCDNESYAIGPAWYAISIHAAQEGCDVIFPDRKPRQRISIHAAQEGCDIIGHIYFKNNSAFQSTQPKRAATISGSRCHRNGRYFNPRSPRGLRPNTLVLCSRMVYFNPRSPRGLRPATRH